MRRKCCSALSDAQRASTMAVFRVLLNLLVITLLPLAGGLPESYAFGLAMCMLLVCLCFIRVVKDDAAKQEQLLAGERHEDFGSRTTPPEEDALLVSRKGEASEMLEMHSVATTGDAGGDGRGGTAEYVGGRVASCADDASIDSTRSARPADRAAAPTRGESSLLLGESTTWTRRVWDVVAGGSLRDVKYKPVQDESSE